MTNPPPFEPESLPSYTDSQTATSPTPAPASTTHPGLSTEHEVALEDPGSRGHKWLILRTKTRPRKPESLPFFWEGEVVAGTVELNMKEKASEKSKGVSISLVASRTFVGRDEDVFYKETQVLWTPPTPEGIGKLAGKQSWPFSFTLPRTVDVEGKSYPLPPTFTLRASPVYIDYKLVVTVKRGFMKVAKALSTTFGHQINTFAAQPSALRQVAYAEGTPVLGPKDDPDGWKVLPPITLKGTTTANPKATDGSKSAEVEITLAVAQPVSTFIIPISDEKMLKGAIPQTLYALGTPIPLSITLKSTDTQALDLLSSPKNLCLELVRSVSTGTNATDDANFGRTDNYFFESEGFAMWWPDAEPASKPILTGSGAGAAQENGTSSPKVHERTLKGEISLPTTLKPTFIFPRCCLRYTLDLQPFAIPGWKWQSTAADARQKDAPLLSERITVTSRQAPGVPKPHSDAPAGAEKVRPANYLKTVGLLENGDQRFL